VVRGREWEQLLLRALTDYSPELVARALQTCGVDVDTQVRGKACARYGERSMDDGYGCRAGVDFEDGDTVLHIAMRECIDSVAWALLQGGASTDIPNRNGETAVMLNPTMVNAVREKDGNRLYKSPLLHAALAEAKPQGKLRDPQSSEPVVWPKNARHSERHSSVPYLPRDTSLVRSDGRTDLRTTVTKQAGVQPEEDLWEGNFLRSLSDHSPELVLKSLQIPGADVNTQVCGQEYGRRAIHDGYGCRAGVRFRDGDTILHIALREKVTTVARALLEAGARVDLENCDGETAETLNPILVGDSKPDL